MRKTTIVLFVLISFVFTSPALAQFSAGLELAAPMGTFGDFAKVGFGVSARYEASIKDKLGWTASIGYLSFGGKDVPVGTQTAALGNHTNIPLTGGIQYYLGEAGSKFYLTGDLSINFLTISFLSANSGGGGGYNISTVSESRVGFAPGVGYRYGSWDFSAKFNLISDFNYANLRIGYVFGSK